MKYCPACQTRYDEEILRFCTKDGTPLIDEDKPSFTELPSESVEDDFGEETVIRRNNLTSELKEDTNYELTEETNSPRIIIPTSKPIKEPQVRTKPAVVYQQPAKPPNTTKLVVTTILGTLIILVSIAGIFWVLSNQNSSNGNQNINVNTNFNSLDSNINTTNFNVDNSLMDFNLNANNDLDANFNANFNTNFNTNIKTPTPTPTRTPTPSPTPSPEDNTNINVNSVNTPTPKPTANVNIKPTATLPPTPTSPTPIPKPSPTSTPVEVGVLNGRALNLPKPAYPPIAKQMNAIGQVAVKVVVDELGNITSAKATNGHPLLRAPAEAAARQSKFKPVIVGNQSVKATGTLLYNFINQ